jgi:lipopolysaccharide/colanic/teichoic acid biosynthesis glycosyltransferase
MSPRHVSKEGLPRALEAGVAVGGLILLLPLLGFVALVIVLTSGRPVLFRQVRVGRNGKPFVLFKFRTMHRFNSGLQVTSEDDVRVTRVGRVLRKTKLDELPELWNVLRGDMSLVGPRPEVPRYVDLKNRMWKLVLKVRPGITDPTTLSLRNEETLLSKVNGDREQFYMEVLLPLKLRGYVEYLRIRSPRTDVGVLCRTIIAVISRRDYSPEPDTEITAITNGIWSER